jgi:hypothetical protein
MAAWNAVRTDPLANRDLGDHSVPEPGRSCRHPACAAGRTDRPGVARERRHRRHGVLLSSPAPLRGPALLPARRPGGGADAAVRRCPHESRSAGEWRRRYPAAANAPPGTPISTLPISAGPIPIPATPIFAISATPFTDVRSPGTVPRSSGHRPVQAGHVARRRLRERSWRSAPPTVPVNPLTSFGVDCARNPAG